MHTHTSYVTSILNLKKKMMMMKTTTACADRSLCGWPACLGSLYLTEGQLEESHAPWCIVEFSCWVMSHTFPSVLFYLCVLFSGGNLLMVNFKPSDLS